MYSENGFDENWMERLRVRFMAEYKIDDFQILCKWSNDPKIRPYAIPKFSIGVDEPFTPFELMVSAMQNDDKRIYMVCDGEKPIGEFSIDMAFGRRVHETPDTAWISLVIGEENYRGKGVGRWIMTQIERECAQLGAHAIELGVFEYNKAAIRLYESMGYEIIAVIPEFVYFEGTWHADIRMLKRM